MQAQDFENGNNLVGFRERTVNFFRNLGEKILRRDVELIPSQEEVLEDFYGHQDHMGG